MPKDSKVHHLYEILKAKGMTKQKAVKIAQAKTGQSLKTGKKPKKKA